MNNIELEIKNMSDYTNLITAYFKELKYRSGNKMLAEFAEQRRFPIEVINESDIFYIGDATEMLLPNYLGYVEDLGVISPTNKKPIFHNRYVIPIKDIHGNILNFVGYSKEADERYVYGTAKYYRRRETMYGLENLNIAYELGWAILTEGITDAIRIRSLGYKNTFANCGTHDSEFIMRQLNRCRYGVIKIPDRDEAGKRAQKKWDTYRSITLNTFIKYKDVDEMCKDSDENIELVKEYIEICIDWIISMEHRGYAAIQQEVTIS